MGNQKEILGWVLDDFAWTIKLPTTRYDRILRKSKALQGKNNRVDIITLQILQGKLILYPLEFPLGQPLLGTLDQIIAIAEAKKKSYVILSYMVTIITLHQNFTNMNKSYILSILVFKIKDHSQTTIFEMILYNVVSNTLKRK